MKNNFIKNGKRRMNYRKGIFLAASLLAVGGGSCAMASDFHFISKPKLYIDGVMGRSDINNRFMIQDHVAPSVGAGFGGGLSVGFQFNPYLGVEVGAMALPSVYYTVDPPIPISILSNNSFYDAAVKGIIPLSTKFNIFGKVGVAHLKQTLSAMIPTTGQTITLPGHEGNQALFGVGVGYEFIPGLQFTVQGTLLPGKTNNVDFADENLGTQKTIPYSVTTKFIGVGLTYKFSL